MPDLYGQELANAQKVPEKLLKEAALDLYACQPLLMTLTSTHARTFEAKWIWIH